MATLFDNESFFDRIESVVLLVIDELELGSGIKLDGNQALVFLVRLRKGYDEELRRICHKYSDITLQLGIQNMLPDFFSEGDPIFDPDRQETFRRISLIAMKYCAPHEEAEHWIDVEAFLKEGYAAWEEFDEEFYFDITLIYFFANLYEDCSKAIRTVNKGASIRIDISATRPWVTTVNKITQRAIELYDQRMIAANNIGILEGSWFQAAARLKGHEDLDVPTAEVDWEKIRRTKTYAAPIVKRLSLVPAFSMCKASPSVIGDQFRGKVLVEEYFAFVLATLAPALSHYEETGGIPGQGYELVMKNDLIAGIAHFGPSHYAAFLDFANEIFLPPTPAFMESFTSEYWMTIFDEVFKKVSYCRANASDIDIELMTPSCYLFELENNIVLIHFGLIIKFLLSLLVQYKRPGTYLSNKGNDFEQVAYSVISEVASEIWKPRKAIAANINGKIGTDLDLSFVRDNIGFLVSCKSTALKRHYLQGDARQVWQRWQTVSGWLNEANSIARYIAGHPSEVGLPEDVDYVVGVVCTGVPEYIWAPSAYNMLDEMTPRVCTPAELASFIKVHKTEHLRRKRCVYRVRR